MNTWAVSENIVMQLSEDKQWTARDTHGISICEGENKGNQKVI